MRIEASRLRQEVYLRESEHVEVGDVILMGVFDSLLALFRVYHLANVFCHKVTLVAK